MKNVAKNNLRIILKPHAYLQTMAKTYVKFRKNRYETVGGFALTRLPQAIHIVIDNAGKWLSSTCKKVAKII